MYGNEDVVVEPTDQQDTKIKLSAMQNYLYDNSACPRKFNFVTIFTDICSKTDQILGDVITNLTGLLEILKKSIYGNW